MHPIVGEVRLHANLCGIRWFPTIITRLQDSGQCRRRHKGLSLPRIEDWVRKVPTSPGILEAKRILMPPAVIAYYRHGAPLELFSDASTLHGLGSVLKQK